MMETDVIMKLLLSKQILQWNTMNNSLWSAIACCENVFLNVHTDEDSSLSATMVIPKEGILKCEDGNTTTHYFCFPSYGAAIPMKPHEILLFDPTIEHCISSGCNNNYYYCLSFYLKTAIVGGNNNMLPMNELQQQLQKKLKQH